MVGVTVAATVVLPPAAATKQALAYSAHRLRLHSTAATSSASCFLPGGRAPCSRLRSSSDSSTSSNVPAVSEQSADSDGVTERDIYDGTDGESEEALSVSGSDAAGFEIEIEKVGDKKMKNRRRIRSQVVVRAELETVWGVLTDYEGLAGFIPSLAVCRLLDRGDNFARLYQVGQQDLALGLKFNAKGVLDCYERDLEVLPTGVRRRNVDFRMVEGDFSTFEGRWSIEQIDCDDSNNDERLSDKKFQTTLIYAVELEPKLFLPVGLIEGRICKEIRNNLFSVRDEAQRVQTLKATVLTS